MIKIKVINYQSNHIQEQILTLETEDRGECLIGRHPSCHLVLENPEISRVHSRILFHDGQYYFSDLGSTDGSRVNNEVVLINQKHLLKQDDVIRMGEVVILIESLELGENDLSLSPHDRTIAGTAPTQMKWWTGGEITVRCVQVMDQTDNVKTFRFIANPPLWFSYQPGQFVTLALDIHGKRILRSYSISSSPTRPHTLDITVKRVFAAAAAAPPGLVSNWLHDHIRVGSQLKLSGPMGQFTCVDHLAQKLLLISAGSGITPMMSMAQWLCDTAADTDVVFFHSARSPRDIVFRQELELMNARHPNFKLAVSVTNPEPGLVWLGYTGRVNAAMFQAIAPDLRDRVLYVCGPTPFMEVVKAILDKLDFPLQNYYEESFGGKKPAKPETPCLKQVTEQKPTKPNTPCLKQATEQRHTEPTSSRSNAIAQPTIVFAKSGKAILCDGEEVILEVAEREGVSLPSGCRMGVCGACKQKLLEGEVKYAAEASALNPYEREQGLILTCLAYPVGRVVIGA
jgi:ferredoxin-NADP reductase